MLLCNWLHFEKETVKIYFDNKLLRICLFIIIFPPFLIKKNLSI